MYMMGGPMFFSLFNIMFVIVFFFVMGTIIVRISKSVSTGVKNSSSPTLAVAVKVLDKRMRVRGEHSHTTYFITFEVESGDRIELEVGDKYYGTIVEGDKGKLTFQGTRFVKFEREIERII